jgi:hypothetical protein
MKNQDNKKQMIDQTQLNQLIANYSKKTTATYKINI